MESGHGPGGLGPLQMAPAQGGFQPPHPGVSQAAPAFRSHPWHWHPIPGAPGCAGSPRPHLGLMAPGW